MLRQRRRKRKDFKAHPQPKGSIVAADPTPDDSSLTPDQWSGFITLIPLPTAEAKAIADRVRKDFGWSDDLLLTCEDCVANAECDFAFDPYNTDGDCLAIK
jgi:hypothetical protein